MSTATPLGAQYSKQCPVCNGLAAIFAKPHCASRTCNWNVCQCHTTWDRITGTHYKSS